MGSTIIDKGENSGEFVGDAKVQDIDDDKGEFVGHTKVQDNEDDKGEIIVDDKGKEDMFIPNKQMEECQKLSEREEIKEELMEDISTITEDEDKLSCVSNSEVNETMILKEPKYRFQNRKKPGSHISLSRSDYFLLTGRKTLRYYNAKSGSYMEVRIRISPVTPNAIDGDHKKHGLCSMTSGEQSSTEEEQDKDDSIEEYPEAHSCVTSEDDQDSYETSSYGPENGDGTLLIPRSMPYFTSLRLLRMQQGLQIVQR